ncbi:H-NS family nucleoid-associated regulatory protein [Aliivibrio sifiae]|uniref:DNA-binding protein n=1 Tax=Aliivibrio sifiae TaxID=566293 RepID=A0A2S7X140_9GAMM|nr:H-NS family nucleoid-associated regulatory protein [Aliivibrio sifiae]PQJ83557.1 hypothetical protein BTO23_20675 [Aliivibrio sifiae]GLR76808.1 DNA-binding protein [Aliivibrio sifiae]
MTPVLKTLLNTRTLRKALNQATLKQRESVLNNITLLNDEIKATLQKKAEEDALKQQELELFKQHIIEKGIDFTALSKLMTGKSKANKKPEKGATEKPRLPLTYHYEKDGEMKQWNGKGDTPNVIKKAIENGLELSDFLRKES